MNTPGHILFTPGLSKSKIGNHPDDLWSAICNKNNREKGSLMGYSLRSRWWRYTLWISWDDLGMKPRHHMVGDGGDGDGDGDIDIVAEELYSHVGASVGDLDVEYVNLLADSSFVNNNTQQTSNNHIHSLYYQFPRDTIHRVASHHKTYVLKFLTEVSHFGFNEAGKKMKMKWEKVYTLDKNGRAINKKK